MSALPPGARRTGLRQLEDENRKLKQLVAEQALDIVGFKAVLSKSGRPQAGREAVWVLRQATKCSERRACGQMEIVRALSNGGVGATGACTYC